MQAWPKNPIDNFVLQQLDGTGPEALARSIAGSADPPRLAGSDGLPPTSREVDAFLADKSPNAYEKVVDRLLASPRYGERMAVRWLDAARYADTNGYQFDGERNMWRWRDWVIDSFNRNQPFDQFTLEQIAGDLLPNATHDQKIATGFNRNHRANTEDGIIPEEYAVEYVVDRVETTSTVFLGATLGCARCHNHKYDPFTQKKFYQMFAYFNNVPELGRAMKYGNSPPVVPAPTRDQQQQLRCFAARSASANGRQLRRNARADRDRHRSHGKQALQSTTPAYWAPSSGLVSLTSFDDQLRKLQLRRAEGRVGRAGVVRRQSLSWTSATPARSTSRIASRCRPGSTRIPSPDGSILSRMADDPKRQGLRRSCRSTARSTSTSPASMPTMRFASRPSRRSRRSVGITSRSPIPGRAWPKASRSMIDGKPAPVKVLLDTLYRPFGNAGKAFREPFRIGAGWGPERRFHGLIDDVRIYNRVLNAEARSPPWRWADSVNQLIASQMPTRTDAESKVLRWYFLENAAAAGSSRDTGSG